MGKMTLGLDDRSARLIHGRDVWTEIRDLLSGYSDIQAAIAFVGSDADQHLPLRGPATIVVNAGDEALQSGATDPDVLLRWSRRGVRVHSLPSLHAKVILAVGNPSFVLVGSADVLSASGRSAHEAVLVADERETVDELREVVAEWRRLAGESLSEAWLQAATSRYRPPVLHRAATLAPIRPGPAAAAHRQAGPVRTALPDRIPAAAPVPPPIRPSWPARIDPTDSPQLPEPSQVGAVVPERSGVVAGSPAQPVRRPDGPIMPPDARINTPDAPTRANEPIETPDAPIMPPDAPIETRNAPIKAPDAPTRASEPSLVRTDASQAPAGRTVPGPVDRGPAPIGVVGNDSDHLAGSPAPGNSAISSAPAGSVAGSAAPGNSAVSSVPAGSAAPSNSAVSTAPAEATVIDAGVSDHSADDDDDAVEPVSWARPKYIYLATLTRDGRPADSAVERLDQLRAEYRVPTSVRRPPILDVQMFWWDEPPRSGGRPSPTYREGWHVVPISVPVSGRPAVLSAVDSPGRVLHSFTDYLASPARTYYYLLQHAAGPSTTFRKLREALTAVGEKPSYDHAYMMQHKVAAILDLWPEIGYDD